MARDKIELVPIASWQSESCPECSGLTWYPNRIDRGRMLLKVEQTDDMPRTGLLIWIIAALIIGVLILWTVVRLTPKRHPNSQLPPAVLQNPIGIVFHHSGTGAYMGRDRVDAQFIDRMHAKNGWQVVFEGKVYHIGYHYVIMPNGEIQAGRPEHCLGAHARGYNEHYLGICFIGNFQSNKPYFRKHGPTKPTKAQMLAAIKLTTSLMQRYHIPIDHVIKHNDLNQTFCPGKRFPFHYLISRLNTLMGPKIAHSPVLQPLTDRHL
ncbi:MAG: peptidoglycan recognition family protein [bacterium]